MPPTAVSTSLDAMIAALGLEVAAIKKRGGSRQVELRGGEAVGQAEGHFLYRFRLTDELTIRDEAPIRVTIGKAETDGTVVSLKDAWLTVALEENLGPKIAFARLVVDDSFLIARLKQCLERVVSGEVAFSKDMAGRILGEVGSHTSTERVSDELTAGLNPEQCQAVSQALGSDTMFLWGPPGTGKTSTLARIVEGFYQSGRSVLLISNTNIAVDTALEMIAERLKTTPEFQQGAVLRLGPIVKDELNAQFGEQVDPERVVARLSADLEAKMQEVQVSLTKQRKARRTLNKALEHLRNLDVLREELRTTQSTVEQRQKAASTDKSQLEHCRAREQKVLHDLERANHTGGLGRFVRRLNPERLRRELEETKKEIIALETDLTSLAAEMERAKSQANSLRKKITDWEARTGRYPPMKECEALFARAERNISGLEGQLNALQQEIDKLRRELVSKCQVLATTVYRTYLKGQVSRRFDVVVIDEASMLMPPMCYYAAGLADSAVVVAGDFRQLQPIVISDSEIAEEWLKRSVFDIAGVTDAVESGDCPDELIGLRTQYRMHPELCQMVNEFFYADHELYTPPAVRQRSSSFPLSDAPLLYVDTSALNPWQSLRLGTYSRYNLVHARLVRNIVLLLAEAGYLPDRPGTNNVLGVVTPYGAQAGLIDAMLQDSLGEMGAGISATVHRFQGNEKDAMILDTTESIGYWPGMFSKAQDLDDDGAKLWNVAISRARSPLIVVANVEFLKRKLSPETYVRRLLQYVMERGEALPLEGLLRVDEDDWLSSLPEFAHAPGFDVAQEDVGVYSEGTFYEAFQQDLMKAQSSIVVFSPFMTEAGTGRWVEPLRAATSRGLQVRIVAKPPGEFGGAAQPVIEDVVGKLRQMGVRVDLRAKMHEKIAIIDEEIVWHGSLNILSHRDTSESMLRFMGQTAAQRIGQFLSSPSAKTAEGKDGAGLADAENPFCPDCDGPTIWKSGRYGIYFECEGDCGGKITSFRTARRGGGSLGSRGKRSTKASTRTKGRKTNGPCPEDGCAGTLTKRNGRFGPFWGCSGYPKCRYTQNAE